MNKKTIWISLIIILFLGVIYTIYSLSEDNLSYVGISINPDVQLAVNNKNIVKEVVSLNSDADIVTSDLDLIGKDVESAVEKLIDEAIKTGYIDEYSDENDVIVTAIDENEDIRKNLENKVMNKINNRMAEKKVYGIVVANGVNEELKAEAVQYGVSNGKMLLIDRAAVLNPELTKEELATMSVKDIQVEIKTHVNERHEALKMSKDELKEKWKKEKKELELHHKNKIDKLEERFLQETNIDIDDVNQEVKDKAIKEVARAKKKKIKEDVEKYKDEVLEAVQKETYSKMKEKIEKGRERAKLRNRRGE